MADVMTTEEVSQYLRLSVQTVKQRARDGRMPAARIGRSWRFLKAEVDRWLARGADLDEDLVDEGLGKAALRAEADPANQGKEIPLEEVLAQLRS
ncbi:MAG: helix-turn-helix domain-containing protein [Armatimonadota bacterium]